MGAPTSTVEIANIALDHLGQPPITSLAGPGETEKLVNRHFDASRQEVLSKHPWEFAQGRATITRTGTPAFDYADKYALPSDFIKFRSIESRELWRKDDYGIDKIEFYANASGASSLNLRYTKDVTTVSDWHADFRELVALTLAKAIAYAITRSNNDVERLTLLLQQKWEEVRNVPEEVPPKIVRRTGATEIVNQALDYLGIDPIKDIASPTTQLENILATHYAQVRKEQLRTHIWKFSKTRAQIARAGTPLFDYPDYYTLPAGCIRLLSIGGDDREVDQELDYDINDRNILVDNGGASTLDIRYVADVTNVTKWDVGFTKIVALHLAQAVGPVLNAPTDKLNYVAQQIIAFKPSALAIDSQEVRPKRIQRSRILTQRMRGVFNPDPRFYDTI